MAEKNKLPAWVAENVPDDAVWSEYYVIANKEEYKNGARITVEQKVKEPREATITGKEVKKYLDDNSSSWQGVFLLAIGAIIAVVKLITMLLSDSSGSFPIAFLFAAGFIIGGVYLVIRNSNNSKKYDTISSWEDLEPHIEAALTKKVFHEECELRQAEKGDTGSAYAGIFCNPARIVETGDFDKIESQFGLMDATKASLVQAALSVPEEGKRLTRKQ